MLDVEVRALWRACRELRASVVAGDAEGILEWVDELEVIAMHTDQPAIRSRALAAIASAMPGAPVVSVAFDGNLCFSFT